MAFFARAALRLFGRRGRVQPVPVPQLASPVNRVALASGASNAESAAYYGVSDDRIEEATRELEARSKQQHLPEPAPYVDGDDGGEDSGYNSGYDGGDELSYDGGSDSGSDGGYELNYEDDLEMVEFPDSKDDWEIL